MTLYQDCSSRHDLLKNMAVKGQGANLVNDKLIFFLENSSRLFLQIVSLGDDLHEMSNCVHWKKK